MSNKIFQKLLSLVVLLVGLLANASLAKSQPVPTAVGNLVNGKYQFFNQPKPNDWHDGTGVCLSFANMGDRIDGYYGYPHSDIFICLRGNSMNDTITGKELGIFWSGSQPSEIPQNRLEWDIEH